MTSSEKLLAKTKTDAWETCTYLRVENYLDPELIFGWNIEVVSQEVSLLITCKNDGRQARCNEKRPFGVGTKMLGYPKECHSLFAYGATAKKHECPKKCP